MSVTIPAPAPAPAVPAWPVPDWPLLTPPASQRGWAYKLDGRLGLAAPTGNPAVDESALSADFILSTPDRDRGGDEMVIGGCDLSKYRTNPVVLLGHRQTMPGDGIAHPVGSSRSPTGELKVWRGPGGHLLGTCFFHQDTAEAVQTFLGVKNGWLCGASIGFNPLSPPVPLAPVAGQLRVGHRFDLWELVEWSIVGVPMNPHCTVIRRCLELGKIEGETLTPHFRKALECLAGPEGPPVVTSGWTAPEPTHKGEFREEDHPRAEDGKFGSGGSGGSDAGDGDRDAPGPEAKPEGKPESKPGGRAERSRARDVRRASVGVAEGIDAARDVRVADVMERIGKATTPAECREAAAGIEEITDHAALSEALRSAGAPDKALDKLTRTAERHAAKVKRGRDQAERKTERAEAARAKWAALEVPPEPHFDTEPWDAIFNDPSVSEKDRARAEASFDRAQEQYDRDQERWEKLSDKKADLDITAGDLESEALDAWILLVEETLGEAWSDIQEVAQQIAGDLHVALDEEEEADPEDEDEDEDEDEPETPAETVRRALVPLLPALARVPASILRYLHTHPTGRNRAVTTKADTPAGFPGGDKDKDNDREERPGQDARPPERTPERTPERPAPAPAATPGDGPDLAALIGNLTAAITAITQLASPAARPPAASAEVEEEEEEDEAPVAGTDPRPPDDPARLAEERQRADKEQEPYRRQAKPRGKATAPAKPGRTTAQKIKGWRQEHADCVRMAADHLDELAGMEAGGKWTGTHAAACRYHSGCVRKALEEASGAAGGAVVPPEEAPEGTPADAPAEAVSESEKAAVVAAVGQALGGLHDQIYRLTGRRPG